MLLGRGTGLGTRDCDWTGNGMGLEWELRTGAGTGSWGVEKWFCVLRSDEGAFKAGGMILRREAVALLPSADHDVTNESSLTTGSPDQPLRAACASQPSPSWSAG